MSKQVFSIVVWDSDFRSFIFSKLHPHMNWKPKKKRWFETQENFDHRLAIWKETNSVLITEMLDFYKALYPELYPDFALVNYGFSPGREKTFFICLTKNEESGLNDDQREHYETLRKSIDQITRLQQQVGDLAFENSCLKDELVELRERDY